MWEGGGNDIAEQIHVHFMSQPEQMNMDTRPVYCTTHYTEV